MSQTVRFFASWLFECRRFLQIHGTAIFKELCRTLFNTVSIFYRVVPAVKIHTVLQNDLPFAYKDGWIVGAT